MSCFEPKEAYIAYDGVIDYKVITVPVYSRCNKDFFLVTANLKSLVSRGKLTQDKAGKALSLLKGVLDYSEFKDVDMVIEVCLTLYLPSLWFQV